MGKHELTHKDLIFRDEMGQKATVERSELGGEAAEAPNRTLTELGQALQSVQPHMVNYTYLGSAAVHIYFNALIEQLDFISQTDPLVQQNCPERIAAKAFDDLLRSMKAVYGRKHGKLRSGF